MSEIKVAAENLVNRLALAVEDGTVYDSIILCNGTFVSTAGSKTCPAKIRVATSPLGNATLSVSMGSQTMDPCAMYSEDPEILGVMDDEEVYWQLTTSQDVSVDVMVTSSWTTSCQHTIDFPVPLRIHTYDPVGLAC